MNASRESRSLNSRTTASPVCRMFRVRLPATTRAKLENRGKMKRCPTQYAFNRVLLQSLHDRQVDTSTLLPPLLLFLLPSNSTLVNFFSPSPHGRTEHLPQPTDQKRPTITRCYSSRASKSSKRIEAKGGREGGSRDLIVSRTEEKSSPPPPPFPPPRYARSSEGWNTNDRVRGKVSGLQILATPSYFARGESIIAGESPRVFEE